MRDPRSPRAASYDPSASPSSAPPSSAPPSSASPSLLPLRRCAASLAVATAVCALSGCSLFVMAGKMLIGDPTQEAPFRTTTGVDLTDGDKTILIYATTPQAMKAQLPGVDLEIVDRVSRRLKTQGVKVHPAKAVLNWLDDRGGRWGDPDDIAEAFDVDYIVHVEVERFTIHEEGSPDLYRGQTSGNVRAFEVEKIDGKRTARPAFSREFNATYPGLHPKPAHEVSERIFTEEFLGRVCVQVSQLFYDYKPTETVF